MLESLVSTRAHLRLVLLPLLLVLPAPSSALVAPHLRSLLGKSRLVVGGMVDNVTEYASGRVAVAELRVAETFKGAGPQPAQRVSVVEMRELPTPPVFEPGKRGIAFLQGARQTTFLRQTIPKGAYHEVAAKRSFLVAATEAELSEMMKIVGRLAAASRKPETDAVRRAESDRRLAFDLLAATHPAFVEDGAASLTSVAGLAATLTDGERQIIESALRRTDLEARVRIALIEAVAASGLRPLAPALAQLRSPVEIQSAAWKALDALGAAPAPERIEENLAAVDPSLRAAAAREVLRREGADGISKIAPLALQDPDASVRTAAIEALGETRKPEAVTPLERAFVQENGDLQRAAARAIHTIGGRPAIEAFGRLTFEAPPESQRYAVVLLLTLTDKQDPVVQHIAETHEDPEVRRLLEHGFDVHKH
jgi:HEAT repeat protein